MSKMTNKEFVSNLRNIASNCKTVYMLGCFGSVVTEKLIADKSRQLPDFYTAAKQAALRKLIGKGYYAFDCVNLIKGILWGWALGGAKYNSNGVPDINADGMITKCLNVSTDFSGIEVGEAVWLPGHIGVYIGDGKVIECTPKWDNCVQVTACQNIGTIPIMNNRLWQKHGKLPYIEYVPAVVKPTAQELVEYLHNTKPVIINDEAQALKKALVDSYIYDVFNNMVNYLKMKG